MDNDGDAQAQCEGGEKVNFAYLFMREYNLLSGIINQFETAGHNEITKLDDSEPKKKIVKQTTKCCYFCPRFLQCFATKPVQKKSKNKARSREGGEN